MTNGSVSVGSQTAGSGSEGELEDARNVTPPGGALWAFMTTAVMGL